MKKIQIILLILLAFAGLACGQSARVKTSPDELAWNPNRTWVYFVGLLEWQDKEHFGSFPQKNRRDEILLNVLRNKGVPESQIVYLKDSQATIAKVKESFPKFLQQAKDGDTVIVYFCGHGYKTNDNKTTFLATYDVSDKTEGWRTDTIPAAVEKYFKGSNAMILADNCYSGALAEDVKALKNPRVSYAVMASSHFNSFSTANWTFTESLIYGFRGDGFVDSNHDGKITFDELEKNAEEDMLFGEEQVASFEFDGNYGKQGIVSIADKKTGSRIGEHIEAYSIDGWYKGFIRDEKDGKFLVRYYGYEESDDEWVPAGKIRQAVTKQYPVGSKVDVNWLGKWYRGKVLEVKGGSHYITFDGFGQEWNEWTPSKRIKEISSAEVEKNSLQFKVGDLVEAQDYRKVWYKSKILAIQDGKYKVHYFGWSENWDEVVTPDRVRNSNDYDFGREVEVEQNGVWYKANLIDSRYGTERLVSYIGYNEDEWVKNERIREIGSSGWYDSRYGKKVEVLSRGKWYAARILDKRFDEFYIHYEGYSDNWNEWVKPDRVREIR